MGPVLPTFVPSEQIFASSVQAWGFGLEFRARYVPPAPNNIKRVTINSTVFEDKNDFLGGGLSICGAV